MTKDELITKGGEWLLAQGVSTVLLGSILAFMAYDKVYLQPQRDQIQREAYKEIQEGGAKFFDAALDRIEEHNERWRQAILGKTGLTLGQSELKYAATEGTK